MHDDDTTAARRALGRRLAHLRRAAGHTQHGLARLVRYGRSSVANTEIGRQHPERPFWTRCDEALRTGGVLTAEFDRIASLNHHRLGPPRGGAGPTSDNPPTWWEDEDHITARRLALTSPAANDARVAQLEHEIQAVIDDNGRCPPATLVARLRPLRDCVDQLMDARQHPSERARLYTAAAHLSGLLAALALDLGALALAHAYAAEAFAIADTARQPATRAWARVAQSLVAFHNGDHRDALAYATDGLGTAGSGPHRLRRTGGGAGAGPPPPGRASWCGPRVRPPDRVDLPPHRDDQPLRVTG